MSKREELRVSPASFAGPVPWACGFPLQGLRASICKMGKYPQRHEIIVRSKKREFKAITVVLGMEEPLALLIL